MLKRTELRKICFDILTEKIQTVKGIYNSCDENFDALGLNSNNPNFDPNDKNISALNIKVLGQNSTNTATAGVDTLFEDDVALQVIVFYASNHNDWANTLDNMCAAVQWALECDDRFRDFGIVISRNTTIDDGTGYTSKVREGGAFIEYTIRIEENIKRGDSEFFPHIKNYFKKLGSTFATSDKADPVKQTTNLPGPFPTDEQEEKTKG